jgi:hypothetical protein
MAMSWKRGIVGVVAIWAGLATLAGAICLLMHFGEYIFPALFVLFVSVVGFCIAQPTSDDGDYWR